MAQALNDFQRRIQSPSDWLESGNQLMESARRLAGNFPTSLMLAAFAVENVIKGLMIVEGVQPVIENDKLDKQYLGAHKLVLLARNIKPAINSDEEKALEWLSGFARWGGRYPGPTSSSDYNHLGWRAECEQIAANWWNGHWDRLHHDGWLLCADQTRRPTRIAKSERAEFARQDFGVASKILIQ